MHTTTVALQPGETLTVAAGASAATLTRLSDLAGGDAYAPKNIAALKSLTVGKFRNPCRFLIGSDGGTMSYSLNNDNSWGGVLEPLKPTGNDDAVLMQEYINDTLASGRKPIFSEGEFVAASGITIRSVAELAFGFNQKLGASILGQGPGSTIIKSAGLGTTPLFSCNYPVSLDGTRRNYLVELGELSILACNSAGSEVPSASPDGVAIAIKPLSGAAEVAFLVKLKRMFINGFSSGLILSDVTSCELERVWFHIFSVGIKLGYNVDILKINGCAFGSEYFNQYNNTVAIQTGYSDGFNTPGGENAVSIEDTWFMAIDTAYEILGENQGPLTFGRNTYFERVKRYLRARPGAAPYGVRVKFDSCLFNLMSTNNVNQPDPTLANYGAKIHFEGDIASSSSGPSTQLTIENCRGDVTTQDNAFVSFNYRGNESIIHWNNNLIGSSPYGHIRCTRSGYSTWVTLPNNGNGHHVFGDVNGGCLTQLNGQERSVSATIASGGTYNLAHYAGDFFVLTLPDGNCTINTLAYAGSNLQNNLMTRLTKMRVMCIVPASVTAARTLTFGAGIKGAGASIAYNTTEQNKVLHLDLVGYADSGNIMLHIGPTPIFN